ncbi:beta-glucanase (GH16 family) [Kineosphaera limosa]|uniref:Putative beta-glucanase n=1 Tax=Kineosphaera limosa NBRC 100340 TaxID=1184609 RepID=K6X5S7_9MICO|nr:glycoside hydrolase family 16 protein [Kineosphaera limosa]NYE02299.1 beta-glucanase (GH16 family) [Kineosphaera limosa]GAB94154.1 putative beta-glucanase [Kineosphaera limosa NBRC 100340]
MSTRMLTDLAAATLPLALAGGAGYAAPPLDSGPGPTRSGPAAHSTAAAKTSPAQAFSQTDSGKKVPPGQAKKRPTPPTPTPTPTPTPDPTAAPEPAPEPTPERQLVLDWRDDFDGPAGAPPNPAMWNYELGGSGRGNQNLEYTTNRPQNASLDGAGNLVLTARSDNVAGLYCWYGPCRYTSGRITTQGKKTVAHGRVEARMKLPKGQGLWPAFWLLGANYPQVGHPQSGEIDIMELVGDEPFRAWASVHGPGYTLAGHTAKYDLPEGSTFNDEFHTFALDWHEQELVFSVDGNEFYRMHRDLIGENEWVFEDPFFVILNLTVGGTWGGEPAADTRFPAQMVIDHIAVYRPA